MKRVELKIAKASSVIKEKIVAGAYNAEYSCSL
jgi:hypothetical protein